MEVTADRLNEVIRCVGYHESVPQYGNRAWLARGIHLDVTYWDEGNSWCEIVQVVPKKGQEGEVIRFLREVQEYPGE